MASTLTSFVGDNNHDDAANACLRRGGGGGTPVTPAARVSAERLPRLPLGRHLDQRFGPGLYYVAAVALALSVVVVR